jgi:hypothetical protein
MVLYNFSCQFILVDFVYLKKLLIILTQVFKSPLLFVSRMSDIQIIVEPNQLAAASSATGNGYF